MPYFQGNNRTDRQLGTIYKSFNTELKLSITRMQKNSLDHECRVNQVVGGGTWRESQNRPAASSPGSAQLSGSSVSRCLNEQRSKAFKVKGSLLDTVQVSASWFLAVRDTQK